MRYRIFVAALGCLALTSCQNGSLGFNECSWKALGLGAAGGAAAGALIGKSWTAAAIGLAVGAAAGLASSKIFAHQLGCEDQERLAQTTQKAATVPKYHRVAYTTASTTDGSTVSGYVMPTSDWYSDPNGRKVRDVRQVLTDGTSTQTATVQVAEANLPPRGQPQGGYVMPQ